MTTTIPAGWKPIESAPKDGTEILAWREDCGQFIASYTSADAFPLTQAELDAYDEATLFAKDWFTQWPDATRLDGSEVPTLWQPLPADPCPTCNDQGAVGNILTAQPCPDCAAPGVSTVEDAQAPEFDLEAAAKALAECMDYPWEWMSEKGRAQMRMNAQAVIDAAIAAQRKGDA
ncbi:hypothetical protein LMG26842_05807 [Achromobacter dolens]|nr:hypothetical protein LMG26842_05807 [Achromobacter dolens]